MLNECAIMEIGLSVDGEVLDVLLSVTTKCFKVKVTKDSAVDTAPVC